MTSNYTEGEIGNSPDSQAGMDQIRSPSSQDGEKIVSERQTRGVGNGHRRTADVDEVSQHPAPAVPGPGRNKRARPATTKARAPARRRRGIRPKAIAPSEQQVDFSETKRITKKPKRRKPDLRRQPPKPTAYRKPEARTTVPPYSAPPAAPSSPAAAPSGEQRADWTVWVKAQRRVLLATGLGFLAGLVVYASLGPDEAPAPDETTPVAKQKKATKRGDTGARPSSGAATRRGAARSPYGEQQAPGARYALPPTVSDPYSPATGHAPESHGAQRYPDAGYGGALRYDQSGTEPYPPGAYDKSYSGDKWPSRDDRKAPSTFSRGIGGETHQAERPWGRVDEPQRRQPQATYPAYPDPIGPYGPAEGYPGPAAGPPGYGRPPRYD